MLHEEQIALRRERAAKETFRIVRQGRNRVFTDYEVGNEATKKRYRVAIRGFAVGDNYCTCPDYAKNTLGTCKHVEAVLLDINRRTTPAVRAKADRFPKAEIFLAYGPALSVKIKLPPDPSPPLKKLAAEHFDKNGVFPPERYRFFGQLMDECRALDDLVVIYDDAVVYVEREEEIRADLLAEQQLVDRMRREKVEINPLKIPLYAYQQEGAVFAAYRGRTVLGDDMGLGKTIQAMAAVELMAQRKGIDKVLVVAPASVKWQWATEIAKFTHRTARVIEGPQKVRRHAYTQPELYKLVNYEVVMRDVEDINAWGPDLIILDEAQRIKNWETKTAKAVKSLRSRYALVMTGTPLENKVQELFSIVEFVDNRRLGPAFQFLADHVQYDEKGKLLGYGKLDQIRERLAPIMLRRRKDAVLKQLPERIDTTYWAPLTPEQKGPHDENANSAAQLMRKWKKQGWLSDIDHKRLMGFLQNMRMLCDSTFLYDKETHVSPKLDEFEHLIDEWVLEGGQKMLAFSEWERMTGLAGDLLTKMKIGFVRLHGGVPSKKRGGLLKQFREDPDCKVFLSTDAGGVGLNLQTASVVLNFDVPWNPAILEQRIGRAHRMGQHRPVNVIHMVTRQGLEERVQETMKLKKDLFKGLFDGTATEVSFAKLGREKFMEQVHQMLTPIVERPVLGPQPGMPDGEIRPAPAGEVAQAGQTLLTAGMELLLKLSRSDSPEPAKESKSGPQAPSFDEIGQKVAGLLGGLVRSDPQTNQPVLHVPMPKPETIARGVNLLMGWLNSLNAGGGGGSGDAAR